MKTDAYIFSVRIVAY